MSSAPIFWALLACVWCGCAELPGLENTRCADPDRPCGAGYYCDPYNLCVIDSPISVECFGNEDCPGELVCDPAFHVCRPCGADSECPGSSVCLVAEKRCIQCASNGDCKTGRCVGGQCKGCTSDQECEPGVGCLVPEDPNKSGRCASCPSGDGGAECESNLCINQVCRRCQNDDPCDIGAVCKNGSCVSGEES